MSLEIVIRKGEKKDLPAVLELVRELALFEKSPESVITTVESMERDSFGEQPAFQFIVAEVSGRIVGMAVYFIKYSTWRGRGLYLDDLIVTESFRGKGVGQKLFDVYAAEGKKIGARQLHWQVLDWNTPAIDFYKKIGARIETEWWDCKIDL